MRAIKYLVTCGHQSPSADNSQPCHFYWDGETLSIKYDSERVKELTFPEKNTATLLSVGGVIENITQASECSGIDITLETLPDSREKSYCYANIKITHTGEIDAEAKKHPLFHRHTNRFKYKKEPIPADVIKNLTNFSEGNARIAVFNDRTTISETANLVRSASEVRFQTRKVHEWLGASLRFTNQDVKKADGLDVRTLDLPPGGKQFLRFISDWKRMDFLNKLGTYKLLSQIDSKPISQAPAIVSIIAPATPSASLDAGKLLIRAWIYLNSVGIAVHPYYVVTDQLTRLEEGSVPNRLIGQVDEIKEKCGPLLKLETDETLLMLLRIGYPSRQPPRSLRLPLARVFTDLTEKP